LALGLLGSVREILGAGTLFSGAALMFGESAVNWKVVLFEDYSGMLLAILPPGAFIGLGLLIALKNRMDFQFKVHRKVFSVQPLDKGNE
jgi:electron transport complex protein RnfE